jgi:NAD(P)-dependent dehydrogenase (short-subunit alcohol dehydrogenase family)
MGKDYFRGRRALISGGSSGIGAAIAAELLRRGAHVFLMARQPARLENTAAELRRFAADPNQKIDFAPADVRIPEQVVEALKACEQRLGPVDFLVNSAGITQPGHVEDMPLESFRAQIETNYLGTVHVVQALLPRMIARREGWITNVASIAGIKGVVGYTQALRTELLRHGIGVTLVCPPDTRTPMLAGESPLRPYETAYLAARGKVLEPDEVARSAVRGMERRKFLVLTGFESKFLHRANGMAPGAIDWMFDRMVRSAQRERHELGRQTNE